MFFWLLEMQEFQAQKFLQCWSFPRSYYKWVIYCIQYHSYLKVIQNDFCRYPQCHSVSNHSILTVYTELYTDFFIILYYIQILFLSGNGFFAGILWIMIGECSNKVILWQKKMIKVDHFRMFQQVLVRYFHSSIPLDWSYHKAHWSVCNTLRELEYELFDIGWQGSWGNQRLE